MNKWEKSRIAAECERALGMTIRQVFDPDEVRFILSRMEKGFVSPLLDPGENDFTPANGFWLIAEEQGEPRLAGGVRFDDLRGLDVSAFWERMLGRAFEGAPKLAVDSFPMEFVSGRTAYFGDLLSKGRVGLGREGQIRLRLFTGVGHFLTQEEFDPDVVYCFLTEKDAARGAPFSYGFLETVPFLDGWRVCPYPGGRRPEWVALTRRTRFPYLLRSLERLTGELAHKKSECSLFPDDL